MQAMLGGWLFTKQRLHFSILTIVSMRQFSVIPSPLVKDKSAPDPSQSLIHLRVLYLCRLIIIRWELGSVSLCPVLLDRLNLVL